MDLVPSEIWLDFLRFRRASSSSSPVAPRFCTNSVVSSNKLASGLRLRQKNRVSIPLQMVAASVPCPTSSMDREYTILESSDQTQQHTCSPCTRRSRGPSLTSQC